MSKPRHRRSPSIRYPIQEPIEEDWTSTKKKVEKLPKFADQEIEINQNHIDTTYTTINLII